MHTRWYRKSALQQKQIMALEQFMLQQSRTRFAFRRNAGDLAKNPSFTWEQSLLTMEQVWIQYANISKEITKTAKDLFTSPAGAVQDGEQANKLLDVIKIFESIQATMFDYILVQSMDTYSIERYLKPYVQNVIAYVGAHHVERQVLGLKKLGFNIIEEIPRKTVKTSELFVSQSIVMPDNAVAAQIVQLTEFSRQDPDHRIVMLCEQTDGKRVIVAANQFKFVASLNQCLSYALPNPLFPIATPAVQKDIPNILMVKF